MKTRWQRLVSFLLIPLLLSSAFIPASAIYAQAAVLMPDPGSAHVKVAHFAPFANTVEGTSVVVTVDSSPVGVFVFGDLTTAYFDISAGTHHVEAAITGGGGVPIVADIDLSADTYYTISLIGNGIVQPTEFFTQIDDTVTPDTGAKVRFTHLAPVAADLDATKIDICTSANVIVPGLAGIAYKQFTDPYLTLPAGDYKLKITQAGSSCASLLVDLPSIRLSNGQILDVFAIGDYIHLPLAFASTTGVTYTPAHVKFAHFAPFPAYVTDTAVTVEVDGTPVLANFKFGDMSPQYLDFAPDVGHLVNIYQPGSGDPIIFQTFTFVGGLYYTVAFIGDVTNQPFELVVLQDDNTRPASGARVRLAHFAAISSNIAFTKMDVCNADTNQVLVANFGYKDVTNPYLSLPAGVYHLKVGVAGFNCGLLPVTLPPINIINFTVVSAFAIGDQIKIAPTVALRFDQPPILSFIPVVTR